MDKFIELNIRDFRAIKEADIALNGITVVTGINGCGKSSISKFLYYALKYANDYEGMATEYLQTELRAFRRLFDVIEQEVARFSNEKGAWGKIRWGEIALDAKDNFLFSVKELIETLSELYQKEPERTEVSHNRVIAIASSALGDTKCNSLIDLSFLLFDAIEQIFAVAVQIVEDRPYERLERAIVRRFGEGWENISLKEYGEQLIGPEVAVTPIPHFVQKTVYIDTPMVVGVNSFWLNNLHWDDLEFLLKKEEEEEYRKELTEVIKSEILHGEVSFEQNLSGSTPFVYTREDGKQFNLLECATGIKSFSIIQLLIKNGFLNEHTLVILDEPEAHLHPQWIVEYARMVVMIHKAIGTKFFIASHSTDMVSAIRYIAEKEGCLKPLSFYLAEEDTENPYQYIYKELRTNIEPIFDSFNKSFDKIEQYGESTGYSTAED